MTLLPFTLDGANDPDGPRSFPTGRPALLCFVKEDCPTSGLSMPLLQIAHEAFGNDVDVWAVGQEAAGNAVLVERHGLDAPMLDDSALKVSFGYDVHTVPTVILADATGEARQRFVGFGRDDWQQLYQQLSELTGDPLPDVDWEALPESRPGCGSRSLEPGIYERLAAEAEGSPLRARLVDVPSSVDEQEFVFDQGLTDGLPVVMPTPERVMRLLDGSNRDAQEVVAVVPPNMAEATIEKIAINAVMAGCRPEYLPVVVAAVEAACTDEFNAHGVMATTMGANPCVIVNGSIRDRIGMNMGLGVFGQGNRANASIGRALMLTLRQPWWRAARWHGALHVRLGLQVHDGLRGVGGTQPVAAAPRRARLRSRSKRCHAGRDAERAAGRPRPDLSNGLRPGREHRARAVDRRGRGGRAPGRVSRACGHVRPRSLYEGRSARTHSGGDRPGIRRPGADSDRGRRRWSGEVVRVLHRLVHGSEREHHDQPSDRGGVMVQFLDPTDERVAIRRQLTARPEQITGTVGLLDISKARGDVLLDRVEQLITTRLGGVTVRRYRKPTMTKPAPALLRRQILEEVDFVIEGLAD